MNTHEIYKTILASLTQVRNLRAEQLREEEKSWPMSVPTGGAPQATDILLDEMARNAAQEVISALNIVNLDAADQCLDCGTSGPHFCQGVPGGFGDYEGNL